MSFIVVRGRRNTHDSSPSLIGAALNSVLPHHIRPVLVLHDASIKGLATRRHGSGALQRDVLRQ